VSGGLQTKVSQRGIQVSTIGDLIAFAKMILASGMAPKGLDTIDKVCVALEAGMELGFGLMQSLSAIGVVNGRPVVYGEAGRALIHSYDLMDDLREGFRFGDGSLTHLDPAWLEEPKTVPDDLEAIVEVKRKGTRGWFRGTFSVAQSKAAGLWLRKTNTGKDTPWVTYWPDQLAWKARWRADRQAFADVLRGVRYREEVEDYPQEPREAEVIPVEDLEALPAPQQPQATPDAPDEDETYEAATDVPEPLEVEKEDLPF